MSERVNPRDDPTALNREALEFRFRQSERRCAELELKLAKMHALRRLGGPFNMAAVADDLLNVYAAHADHLAPLDQAVVALLDDGGEWLVARARIGFDAAPAGEPRFRIGEGCVGKAALAGALAVWKAGSLGEDHPFARQGGGALLVAPLYVERGGVIGVLAAHQRSVDAFGDLDVRFYRELAEHVANAIDARWTPRRIRDVRS